MSRNPAYPEGYQGLADALLALGRADEAIGQLEAGLKEVPEHRALKLTLGRACLDSGRFKEARTELEDGRSGRTRRGPWARRPPSCSRPSRSSLREGAPLFPDEHPDPARRPGRRLRGAQGALLLDVGARWWSRPGLGTSDTG